MRELVEKKRKASIICLVLMAAMIFSFLVGLAFISSDSMSESEKDTLTQFPVICVVASYVLLIIWLAKYRGCIYTYNFFKKRDIECFLDDINLRQPVLPKSQIYCGSRAFYCKKPFTVLPYAEIAWVYVEVRKIYGIIPAGKLIHVLTREGKHLTLQADSDEFKWLLETYLIKVNPNIIVGFGAQQKESYKAYKAAYKASINK